MQSAGSPVQGGGGLLAARIAGERTASWDAAAAHTPDLLLRAFGAKRYVR